MEYGTWDKTFSVEKTEEGELHILHGTGLKPQEREYSGEGRPFACQAVRQKLLLGSCVDKALKNTDIAFGIKKINHSYCDWTGNPFEDYEIDILQGTKKDVYSYLTNHKCFIGCEECYGCGDW